MNLFADPVYCAETFENNQIENESQNVTKLPDQHEDAEDQNDNYNIVSVQGTYTTTILYT